MLLTGMCFVFTARQQSAVLAIVNPSVRPSVRLSVTRWHCVKTQNDSSYQARSRV